MIGISEVLLLIAFPSIQLSKRIVTGMPTYLQIQKSIKYCKYMISIIYQYTLSLIKNIRGGNPQQFLSVQISQRCSDFHFHSNPISRRSHFRKGVHIFIFFKQQSRRSDFRMCVQISVFDQNRNLNTFSVQIQTGKVSRFQFLSKTQIFTHLRKSVRLDLRFEENENVNTYFCTTCSDLRFEIK